MNAISLYPKSGNKVAVTNTICGYSDPCTLSDFSKSLFSICFIYLWEESLRNIYSILEEDLFLCRKISDHLGFPFLNFTP